MYPPAGLECCIQKSYPVDLQIKVRSTSESVTGFVEITILDDFVIALIISVRVNVCHVGCNFLAFNRECARIENMKFAGYKICLCLFYSLFRSGSNVLAEMIDNNRSGLKSSRVICRDLLSSCCLCDRIGKVRSLVYLTVGNVCLGTSLVRRSVV